MDATSPDSSSCSDNLDDFELEVDSTQAGQRFDRFLSSQLPEYSRSILGSSIKKGTILVDGIQKKNSYKLKRGERVSGWCDYQDEIEITPEAMELDIIYEDEWIIVLSKSPDLVVHPGAGNSSGTLVNGLVHYCDAIMAAGDDKTRPGIVHRLDKDTSGVMVIAKNAEVHKVLSDMFKNRTVKKTYQALVHRKPMEQEGRIVAAIGRHPVQRKKMCIRAEEQGGRYAVSNWKVIRSFLQGRYSLVEVHIETGRTHQIRVHMASLGCPVVGDQLYGPKKVDPIAPRQLLHACSLEFAHPHSGKKMAFKAPLCTDFSKVIEMLSAEDRKLVEGTC